MQNIFDRNNRNRVEVPEIDVRGEELKDGSLKIWAADKNGVLCGEMDLEFAA